MRQTLRFYVAKGACKPCVAAVVACEVERTAVARFGVLAAQLLGFRPAAVASVGGRLLAFCVGVVRVAAVGVADDVADVLEQPSASDLAPAVRTPPISVSGLIKTGACACFAIK